MLFKLLCLRTAVKECKPVLSPLNPPEKVTGTFSNLGQSCQKDSVKKKSGTGSNGLCMQGAISSSHEQSQCTPLWFGSEALSSCGFRCDEACKGLSLEQHIQPVWILVMDFHAETTGMRFRFSNKVKGLDEVLLITKDVTISHCCCQQSEYLISDEATVLANWPIETKTVPTQECRIAVKAPNAQCVCPTLENITDARSTLPAAAKYAMYLSIVLFLFSRGQLSPLDVQISQRPTYFRTSQVFVLFCRYPCRQGTHTSSCRGARPCLARHASTASSMLRLMVSTTVEESLGNCGWSTQRCNTVLWILAKMHNYSGLLHTGTL